MPRRISFCGSINGTVSLHPGETEDDAIQRPQELLLDLMDRSAKRLGLGDGHGPNIGLELDPIQSEN